MDILTTLALQIIPTSVFAGLFAAIVSNVMQRRTSAIAKKREILNRIAGYRHTLTSGFTLNNPSVDREPLFTALNEAFLVFSDDELVVAELKAMLKATEKTTRLVPVMKAMAKAAKVHVHFDDEFLNTPFTYNH